MENNFKLNILNVLFGQMVTIFWKYFHQKRIKKHSTVRYVRIYTYWLSDTTDNGRYQQNDLFQLNEDGSVFFHLLYISMHLQALSSF